MALSPDPASIDGTRCAICDRPHENPDFASNYVTMVCSECDSRAVNIAGNPPLWESMYDSGENPVFVDGHQCWRRYRFGGYVTMRDCWNTESLEVFYDIILD
jgi:hypothetical protein